MSPLCQAPAAGSENAETSLAKSTIALIEPDAILKVRLGFD